MARRTVFVSDLTGGEIDTPAKITISFPDGKTGSVVLDVDAAEIHELIAKGRRQGRRGRPTKEVAPVAAA